jgi:hypothetical protein
MNCKVFKEQLLSREWNIKKQPISTTYRESKNSYKYDGSVLPPHPDISEHVSGCPCIRH